MITVYLMGKKYEVPESLTIMALWNTRATNSSAAAAAATASAAPAPPSTRVKGSSELKMCLACSTKVEENMYVATLPYFPWSSRSTTSRRCARRSRS